MSVEHESQTHEGSQPLQQVKESKSQVTTLPAEDTYELLKIQALEACKAELVAWARRRFWLVALALAAIGFFGGISVIERSLERQIEKKVDKEVSGVRSAALAAQVETELSRRQISEALKRNQDLVLQIEELQQRLESSNANAARLVGRGEKLEQEVKLIEKRIGKSNAESQDLESFLKQADEQREELDFRMNDLARYGTDLRKNLDALVVSFETARSDTERDRRDAGLPAIWQILQKDQVITVSGANFGTHPGAINIKARLWISSTVMEFVSIFHGQVQLNRPACGKLTESEHENSLSISASQTQKANRILAWESNRVVAQIDAGAFGAMRDSVMNGLEEDQCDSYIAFHLEVVNKDGHGSRWSDFLPE